MQNEETKAERPADWPVSAFFLFHSAFGYGC
jgi:hypothetical protein